MIDYRIGKGVYIWKPEKIENGDPGRITGRLVLAGVESVALKICDGINVYRGLEPLIKTLRDQQIQVLGWGYSFLNRVPTREAQAISVACRNYGMDLYLIDVEKEVEGNYNGAAMFMESLRYALPETRLGLNSFWNVNLHPSFPWQAFLEHVDFVCPQIYWRAQRPLEKLQQSKKGYASLSRSDGSKVPMPFVAGDMFTERGIKPTVLQLLEFMESVAADNSMQGVLMWAADDNETTSDLWQAFSAHRWQKAGRNHPVQPAGWAQIKYGMHVRSSPQGSKLRGLTKNELVPVWEVTESKWAAITSQKDEWIYVGDPTLIEAVLVDDSQKTIPAGLYRAVVLPARGLNVRQAAYGNRLRVLRKGEIVEVYKIEQGWAKISYDKEEWVNAAYLRKQDAGNDRAVRSDPANNLLLNPSNA